MSLDAEITAPTTRPRGLFLNTTEALCSIYQSGKMVYDNVRSLPQAQIDYIELDAIDADTFNKTSSLRLKDGSALSPAGYHGQTYEFVVFNYHPFTMAPTISADAIRRMSEKHFSIVLEIDPGNAYAQLPAGVFDGLIVLDPTISGDEQIWPFPRPLEGEPRRAARAPNSEAPTIGSFGFGTPGKGFDLLISAVNLEFEEATVRINIPPSTYADPILESLHQRPYAEYLAETCRQIAKPGIKVEISHDFMSETELVDWCEENDINCFMYTRRQTGLSATTDQAIISGRPLLISANDTFRHIHPYIQPYPRTSIRDALASTLPKVRDMQDAWDSRAFGHRFLEMLRAFDVLPPEDDKASSKSFVAPRHQRKRIAVGLRRRRVSGGSILDWEDRVLQALRKSVLGQVYVFHFDALRDIQAAAFWCNCERLLILDEFGTLDVDPLVKSELDVPGGPLKIVFARRGSAGDDHGWISLGPIIPFFTAQFRIAPGRTVVGLHGFETIQSNLADVVAKMQRELGVADIRLHLNSALSEEARSVLDQRLSLVKAQLLPTSAITITIVDPIADTPTLMATMGQYAVNIFSDTGTDRGAVSNLIDLAMTVDRIVCHTRAAPMLGYVGLLAPLEDHSFAEWLAGAGRRGQAATYNRLSEARVMQVLEDVLGLGLSAPGQNLDGAAADDVGQQSPDNLMSANPNGLLNANSVGSPLFMNGSRPSRPMTVDEKYRPGATLQQDYLIAAIRSLHNSGPGRSFLLVGDGARKSAAVLGDLGYRFDHLDIVRDDAAPKDRYALVAFLNAQSGCDELRQNLLFASRKLAPGGCVLMTFFFVDSYNVGRSEGNMDFPLISEREIHALLAEFTPDLTPVTAPGWRSDKPDLNAHPFDLPPYGALTLRKAAGASAARTSVRRRGQGK